MSIAHEFFKDDSTFMNSIEDQIIFFIENYEEYLKTYRVAKCQVDESSKKNKLAHEELQKLRQKTEEIKKSKRQLSDQEKLALREAKAYLSNLREEGDIIYYKGKELPLDQITMTIIKYQNLFSILEKIDRKGRTKMASCVKKGSCTMLNPLKRILSWRIKKSPKSTKLKLLKVKNILNNIPKNLEKSILNTMEVDLDKHLPNHD